ncbi:MAG: sulfite exporter TauE/SafE family protein [Actinomycetota bacterium]|nr:sulfite exporter TauE/SafE family protein [Actinomycetota bacterium]
MTEVLIGFLAGYFSGHFGLGGGLITTPAIRLWLGRPALIAVGTPLLVNIPTAIAGAYSYNRKGFIALDLVPPLAISGMVGAVAGALATRFVSGHLILLITAAVIFSLSWRFILRAESAHRSRRVVSRTVLVLSGLGIGVASGFLGLGGGFLLVPFLSLFLGLDMKTTFGTSLAVVGALTIPGVAVHYLLGHVDLNLGALLVIGVIPGALLGSWVAMRLPNRWLRVMFGVLLSLISLYMGYFELTRLVP